MKYNAVSTVEPEYLRITVTGEYAREDMPLFIGHVKSEADKAERDQVLIDCGRIMGEMTDVERFEGGQLIADIFGPELKAALVMPVVTKFGELVAVNRGARFLATTSADEALDWLLTP